MARELNSFLTFLVLDIINRRDFIDYGILTSHTQIFFDRTNFDVVIVSPYYFQYVSRNGDSLLDDFMNDPRFNQWINETYQEVIYEQFNNILGSGGAFDFIPVMPEIVLVETMDYDELKQRRKGITPRHS